MTNERSATRGSTISGGWSDAGSCGGGSGCAIGVSDRNRLEKVRLDASIYVERFRLRELMQDMFQRVIYERPEEPFEYMRGYLLGPPGGPASKILRSTESSSNASAEAPAPVVLDADQAPQLERPPQQALVSDLRQELKEAKEALLAKEQELSGSRQALQAKEQEATQLQQALEAAQAISNQQARDLAAATSKGAPPKPAAEGKAAQELESERLKLSKERFEHDAQLANMEQMYAARFEEQRQTITSLQQRLEELDTSKSAQVRAETDQCHNAELTQLKAKLDVLQNRIAIYESNGSRSRLGAQTPPADMGAGAPKAEGISAISTASTTTPFGHRGMASFANVSTGASTEVNALMLSQLLASTYAPSVKPQVYMEVREDEEESAVLGANPELLVDVTGCRDKTSNGTYAWVGVWNLRPMYRLLGAEPRYLYYVESSPTAGWRIVEKMGAEDCVERFGQTADADARLPVHCQQNELGGRILEARLTRETVCKISLISSHEEKLAIRQKLNEVFGKAFVRLEAVELGMIAKTSPVVGIAHCLEAQQRVIQQLHSQVAVEIQRRETAEAQATAIQDAFETLDLRIQAQMPGFSSMNLLKELQASIASPRRADDKDGAGDRHGMRAPALAKPDFDHSMGCTPVMPISPKEVRPAPPPTFRAFPSFPFRHINGPGQDASAAGGTGSGSSALARETPAIASPAEGVGGPDAVSDDVARLPKIDPMGSAGASGGPRPASSESAKARRAEASTAEADRLPNIGGAESAIVQVRL